ncbi:ankyrin repeat and SOCS box protein 10-like [Glandiceps talaboti]
MFFEEFYDCLLNGDSQGLDQALKYGQSANITLEQPQLPIQLDYHCACGKTTPLLLAVCCGYVECLKVLIENGAAVNLLPCQSHHTALQLASRSPFNSGICAEILLSCGAIVNIPNSDGYTPLHTSVSHGKLEVAQLLLESGAEVNRTAFENESPLLLAASYPLDFPMIQLLLKHGANPKLGDKYRNTPLQLATKQVHLHAVKLLLQHGADPNTLDIYHQTPLFCAAKVHIEPTKIYANHPSLCVQALLNYGANIRQICLGQNIFQVVMRQCPDNFSNLSILLSGYDHIDALLKPLIQTIPKEIQCRYLQFYKNCSYLSKNPRSLQHLSRCVIRRVLGKSCQTLATQLPLPDRLQLYILLDPYICRNFYL